MHKYLKLAMDSIEQNIVIFAMIFVAVTLLMGCGCWSYFRREGFNKKKKKSASNEEDEEEEDDQEEEEEDQEEEEEDE